MSKTVYGFTVFKLCFSFFVFSPSALSGAEYYILTENLFTGDAYGPEKFKFHSDFNGKKVDITLIMSGDVENCTHVIEIVG